MTAGAGALITLGPPWPVILFGVVTAALGGLLVYWLAGATFFTVELPLVLLLLSTLTWRARSAMELASNPADAAGTLRIGLVAVGGMLGLLGALQPNTRSAARLPLPLRLYGTYVAVVLFGAFQSINLFLTGYRAAELAIGLVVLLAALRTTPDALARVERVLYWFTVALASSVWAGVLVAPSLAVAHPASVPMPITVQILGAYPTLSANSVGAIGVLLLFWSLVRPHQRWRVAPVVLGLACLLGAQYRTGYVTFAAGMVVLLVLRRRWLLLVLCGLLVCFAVAYRPSLIGQVTPYILRGDTFEQARGLDSRIDWWTAALPIWRDSPLIGKGLLTGTRFEVLPRLGVTEASTIHGTWIEALVGTGLVGCGLLAFAYLAALRRAVQVRWWLGVVLLAVIGVRSLTGPSIELFGTTSLLFGWIALGSAGQDIGTGGIGDQDEGTGGGGAGEDLDGETAAGLQRGQPPLQPGRGGVQLGQR